MTQRSPLHPLSFYRGIGPPVQLGGHGQRADAYLARFFPFRTRRAWREVCDMGHLLVNGQPIRPSRRLAMGDRLSIYHPAESEPEVDTNIRLILAKDGILAFEKPGNLPMHEAGLYWNRTFQSLVAETYGPEWHAVHRLDRETSGIVICASSATLRRDLSFAFESHRVSKTYIAIVKGEASWSEIEIDAPIGEDPDSRFPRSIVRADGSSACTQFRVLQRKDEATLIEAKPKSGRYNQIRVHAAHLGLPLVGDKVYQDDPRIYQAYQRHGDTPRVRKLAGHDRHCLHAASIAFRHPETQEIFRVEAPLPEDMIRFWHGAEPVGVEHVIAAQSTGRLFAAEALF